MSDDDVRFKYDQKARRATKVSKVRLAHILIELANDRSDEELASVRNKAHFEIKL